MNKLVVLIAFLIFVNSIASFVFQPSVLALMIPLIAIIAFSPIGRAIASLINGDSKINTYSLFSFSQVNKKEFEEMKQKYAKLEQKINDYDAEVTKMRESIVFYENKKISTNNSSNNQDEKKGKIDLTKRRDNHISE